MLFSKEEWDRIKAQRAGMLSEIKPGSLTPPTPLNPRGQVNKSGGTIIPNRDLFTQGPLSPEDYQSPLPGGGWKAAEAVYKPVDKFINSPLRKVLSLLNTQFSAPIRGAMEGVTEQQRAGASPLEQLAGGAKGFQNQFYAPLGSPQKLIGGIGEGIREGRSEGKGFLPSLGGGIKKGLKDQFAPTEAMKTTLSGDDKYSWTGTLKGLDKIIGAEGTEFERNWNTKEIQNTISTLALPLEVFLDLDVKGLRPTDWIKGLGKLGKMSSEAAEIAAKTGNSQGFEMANKLKEKVGDIMGVAKGQQVITEAMGLGDNSKTAKTVGNLLDGPKDSINLLNDINRPQYPGRAFKSTGEGVNLLDGLKAPQTQPEDIKKGINLLGGESPFDWGKKKTDTLMGEGFKHATKPVQGDIDYLLSQTASRTKELEAEAFRKSLVTADFDDLDVGKKTKAGINLLGKGPKFTPVDELSPSNPQFKEALRENIDPSKWKKQSTLKLAFGTDIRNVEAVTGEDAEFLKKNVFMPIRDNDTKKVRFLNKTKDYLGNEIEKARGIKAGSTNSKLLQEFGGGEITLEELKIAAPKDWEKIKQSSDEFRGMFDASINKVNEVLEAHGMDPISKEGNYFHRMTQADSMLKKLGIGGKQSDMLPVDPEALDEILGASRPFSVTEIKRIPGADNYVRDGVASMEHYLDSVSNVIYHTDSVQRVRGLQTLVADYIREEFDRPGFLDKSNVENLIPYYKNLKDFGNILAGKGTELDEVVAGTIMGKGPLKALSTISGRVSTNMVGGNISAAITNFLPFTMSTATTKKKNVLEGIWEAVKSPLKEDFSDIGGESSDFLTRRFPKGKIATSLGEDVRQASMFLNTTVDKYTAKSIVAGKYYEMLEQGLDSKAAMRVADDYGARLLLDRSVGGIPNVLNSKSLGPLLTFQSEINNQFSFLSEDMPKMYKGNKELAGKFAEIALYGFVANELTEKITGRRMTIDPINWVLEATGIRRGDIETGQRLKGVAADISGNLPVVGNVFGGRLPLQSAWENPLYYLAPPTGGAQAKKMIGGIPAAMAGKSVDASGRTKFEIPDDERLKVSMFGPFSASTAPAYLDRGHLTEEAKKERDKKKKKSSSRPSRPTRSSRR